MNIQQLEIALRELMAVAAANGLSRSFAELQYTTIKGFGKLTDKAV
jgi:hypothetical protein